MFFGKFSGRLLLFQTKHAVNFVQKVKEGI